MKTKETMQVMTKLEHKQTHIMTQYEQGYKTGFKFGKEYTNEKHIIDLMNAKNHVEDIFQEIPCRGLVEVKLQTDLMHIFDVLIEKCGGQNGSSN